MKQFLRILGVVLLLSNGLFAQEKTINGKITDDRGETLPGVNISVQGTTKGVTSDVAGKYSIKASSSNTLVFTYVGMTTQKVLVGNLSVINVILKGDASELDEVVVTTAFGTDKNKRTLGYATQTISGDDISESGRENIFNALQSRVAGATINATSGAPGASSSLVLRGFNSLSGNNSPLIVIDGLPINNSTLNQGVLATGGSNRDNDFSNRLSDLNPNDIESLTVLKGPEATSLYGIDAGSGAIIIKTKKGQVGKPMISYSNNFRIDQTYLFPEATQTVYGTGLGGTSALTLVGLGPKIPEGTPVFNNVKNFFKDATTQSHNLSMNGGKGQFTYRLSGSSINQTGTIPNTGYDRYNGRVQVDYRTVDKKLTLSASGSYSYAANLKALRGAGGYLEGLMLWPVTDDASLYVKSDGQRRRFLDNLGISEIDNPFWSVNKNKSEDATHRRNYNFSANYSPLDWLNLTAKISYDGYNQTGYTYYHPLSNLYYNVGGQIEEYTAKYTGLSGVFMANVEKNVTKKIHMGLRVGTAVDDFKTETFSVRGQGLAKQVSTGDYTQQLYSINPATRLDSRSLGRDTLTLRRLQGVFGEYTLSYEKWLTLTITGRNDWTSTLPESARSFFYPAASLAFVFSDLLPKNKVLSFGKLRGSLAQTAKDISPYNSQSVYAKQLTSGLGYGYGFTNNNPGIVPERQSTFEIGTELKFFNGRLGIDAAYYNTKNIGQIVKLVRLSYGSGFVLATLNVADTRNQGVELILTGQPIKSKNLLWNTTFNFSKTTNEVLNLPANIPEYYNSDTFVSAFRNGLIPGGTTTTITGQDYLRNSKGQILIDPGTGNPLVNPNYQKIGDRNPDFSLGINNSFDIKQKITFSFLFDIRKGGDIMNGTAYARTLQGQTSLTLNREKAQIVPGVLNDGLQETDKPTINTIQIFPQYQTYYQDGRLYAANFMEKNINWLRLREVSLRYTLPKQFVQRLGFEKASVFVAGTDLFVLTNYSGADPSVNANTASTQGIGGFGIDWFTASTPRGFSAGLKVDLKVK
jgi:TonB-linked SusC/RagA family outer membrane protein